MFGVAFVHNNRCYYYDANKNHILEISSELFKELKKNDVSQKRSEDYCFLEQKGYFKCSPIQHIELGSMDFVMNYCERNLTHLILQITQKCNFKCRYCTFAGDGSFERTHQEKNMDFNTAKKSVDFLLNHSIDSQEIQISFYGGEPLLNYDIVKEVIIYSQKQCKRKKCYYAITTNASLLNDEMVDFFATNDVQLDISIDGPQEIQDQFRRFSSNGKGTYRYVLNNILRVRSRYPGYYDRAVFFHPVINPNSNLDLISSFLKSKLGTIDDHIRFSKINTAGLKIIFDNNSSKPLNETAIIENTIGSKLYQTFLQEFLNKSRIPSTYHHGGPCMPGSKKLFVNTEGVFYPCEKVNERYSTNIIGNLDEGFNFQSIYRMYNIGQLTKEKCKSCWCIRFCKLCIADIQGSSMEEIVKRKEMACDYQKKQFIRAIKYRVDGIV